MTLDRGEGQFRLPLSLERDAALHTQDQVIAAICSPLRNGRGGGQRPHVLPGDPRQRVRSLLSTGARDA